MDQPIEITPEKKGKNLLFTLRNIFSQITVEPYLFFSLMGYTVREMSFQSLMVDRACRNMFKYSDDICSSLDYHPTEKSNSLAAGNNLYTGVMLLSGLPAAIVAVFLGPWSDKYTRKYPMILAATGMFLESLCFAILTAFPGISPIWYVVTSIFNGMSGGLIVSMSSTASYMSDITDERNRAGRFAIMEFANILAVVIGNILGGQVYKNYGYLQVLTISPVSFGCCALYAMVFIKETKPSTHRDRNCEMARDLFKLDNIKQSYYTCSKKRPGSIRLQIWFLIFINCCQRFTDLGSISIAFSFTNKMYGWDVTDVSNSIIYFYIVEAIVTVVFVPFMTNKLKLHEAALGFCGMLSLMSKMVVTSLAYRQFMFYFAWMSGTLATASYISVKSRLSKLVRQEELGSAFSLLGTCESLMPLLGSTAFLQIMNAAPISFPGLSFAVAGCLLVPCTLMYLWMMGLPTVSLADFKTDEENSKATPMQNISFSTNSKSHAEKY